MTLVFGSPCIAVAIGLTAATSAAAQTRTIDADALPRLRLIAEQRIGHADDATLSFNRIRFVEVDRDGQVYVYDSQTSNIRVFARNGTYVRTIGRGGNGPGEFSSRFGPQAFGMIGDTLWSFETLGRRVNIFRRDGTIVSTIALSALDVIVPVHRGAVGMLRPGFMRGDGSFVSSLTTIEPNGEFEVRALRGRGLVNQVRATDTVLAPIVLFTPRSARLDTIGFAPLPPYDGPSPAPAVARGGGRSAQPGTVQVGGVSYSVPASPWISYLQMSLIDGSAVVSRRPATTDRAAIFELVRFDIAGKTAHRIRFTYKPSRYDGPVLDSLAMREVTRRGEPNAAAFRAVRSAMSFPDFQAPVYTAWRANDGALWLRREWDGSDRHRWIVVGRDGAARGIVALPSGARPVWARDDLVIAEEPDENDVPWLVRYRIQPRP